MPSPIVVPFNFQPTGPATVKTSSYTPASGKYALVDASCAIGGTVTIGGSAWLKSVPPVRVMQRKTTNQQIDYTVTAGYYFEGWLYTDGGTTYGYNGANTTDFIINTLTFHSIKMGPGERILSAADNVALKSLVGYEMPSNPGIAHGLIWIDDATTLSGTGDWQAAVTEYTEIT